MADETITLNLADDTRADHPVYWDSPPVSDRIDQLSLSAGVAATWTVPARTDSVIITYTAGTLYAATRSGVTAATPAATKTDNTGSFKVLDGSSRRVFPGQTISFFNASNCVVSFEILSNGRRGGS